MRPNDTTRRAAASESNQRERVLAGMLAVVHADGYSGATVARVIARAGVSRLTFYEHFSDKDECFLALYRDLSRQLLDQIGPAITNSPPEQAMDTVVRQLTKRAEAEPAQAEFLASDALAGGPRVREERARTIGQIGDKVQAAHAVASPRTPSPDIPAQAVIGACQSLISQRMRRGERDLTQLSRELTHWLTHYEQRIGKHRWSTLSPGPPPDRSTHGSGLPGEPPPFVPSKGSRPLPSDLGQNRRSRILYATAESAVQTGYTATTVSAIISRARLHKQAFYGMFRDKDSSRNESSASQAEAGIPERAATGEALPRRAADRNGP
jgi:AcrR family transcriptional regulator